MYRVNRIRLSPAPVFTGATPAWMPSVRVLLALLFVLHTAFSHAQSATFQITSSTYTLTNGLSSSFVPAGANGAQLLLTGTLPTADQQAASSLQACFYTGFGSTTGIPLSLPSGANAEPLVVPASTIQSIPQSSFAAASGNQVPALIYFIAAGSVCDGTFDSTLTNQFTLPVVAPAITAITGPSSIPQTNPATSVQSAPLSLTFSTTGLPADARVSGSTAAVSFGTFGNVPATILPSLALSVPVPSAFASSSVGTSVPLTLCYTASAGSNPVCTTPSPAITLTVVALAASTGTVTATPDPVLVSGQTVLKAQFSKTGTAQASPGTPSGLVSFVADGNNLAPAPLVLDPTASFSPQTTSVSTPAAAAPVITPNGGNFTTVQTIVLSDATAGASIFYTQDGSTPTNGSTLYTAPFQISTSQTIQAIASAPGSLNSATASAAFTITVSPPTQLVFSVQPASTAINTAIAPAVQVALEDANGNIVTSATNAVTIALQGNPGQSTLSGTTTVNAVNGIATFADLALNNIASGYTLLATSGNLTSALSSAFNITPYPITMTVQSALIGIGSALTGNFTLAHAAPTGGLTVTLASDTPANVTVSPGTVIVAAGQTTGNFTYTGVASGNATLSASAPNYQTGTVQVTGTAAQVSLDAIPNVAPGQMVSLALSLPMAAPPGGTTVTFKSSNTNIATVTSSVFVPAGQFTAATNPQVSGVAFGNTTILASAPGYAPATRPVTVTVTASFNPTTTNLNLITSTNTTLNINAPAQTGGITFTLSTDDPTIATVASPVTIASGATKVPVTITGKKDGTTNIRADATGVAEAVGTVTINSTIVVPGATTGVKLESYFYVSLPVSPSVPTTVTVTSSNPQIATLSTAQGTVGTASVTFTNVTSSNVGYVYLQGQSQGTTTISIAASGYTTGTGPMTVDPSGFSYYIYGSQSFSTTTFSNPTTLTVYTTILDPATGNYVNLGQFLNPGLADISLPVTSSNTAVGTVTSPVVFHAQDTQESFTFKPLSAGTATIALGTPPAPFSVPTYQQTTVATVSKPVIPDSSVSTGVKLDNTQYLSLPVAPPSPVDVTITSNGPAIAVVSTSGTVAGGTSITIPGVSSTNIGYIYVQGVTAGTTTLTISAPGYTSGTDTVTVYPSGFGYYYYYGTSYSTQTNSGPSGLTIYTELLDPSSLNAIGSGLGLSPTAGTVIVPVTSSNTSVGTITSSPLTFTAGVGNQSTSFQPAGAGTANVTVGTPAGFSTPTTETVDTFTVTAPSRAISFGNDVTTGAKLQNTVAVYLSSTPTGPVNVTVTSANPAIATVSNAANTTGTTSTTFTGVTSTYVGTVYVQGQAQGSTTLTASATNYSSATNNITVDPSGFTFSYYNSPNQNTTTFSSPTGINVYSQPLDPNTLALVNYPLNLNPNVGPISVAVTSSAPEIGTITTSPVMITANNDSAGTSFKPVSAGTSNITLSTPAGFSTPSNDNSIAFTVTAPQITVNDVETGLKLETAMYISLPQTPPNPVTVTVTSNGPQIAVISTDGTVVGGSSVTFTNVTSQNVGYIYVQGVSIGATTLTVSAPGYLNGNANITVDPSGFAFPYANSFNTSSTSGPTTLDVYPVSLTPGTLTVISYSVSLAPGFGNVSVPVTSSDTGVGTITTSPVIITPGSGYAQTSFQPATTGMTTLTVGTPTGFSTPSQYTQYAVTVQ